MRLFPVPEAMGRLCLAPALPPVWAAGPCCRELVDLSGPSSAAPSWSLGMAHSFCSSEALSGPCCNPWFHCHIQTLGQSCGWGNSAGSLFLRKQRQSWWRTLGTRDKVLIRQVYFVVVAVPLLVKPPKWAVWGLLEARLTFLGSHIAKQRMPQDRFVSSWNSENKMQIRPNFIRLDELGMY